MTSVDRASIHSRTCQGQRCGCRERGRIACGRQIGVGAGAARGDSRGAQGGAGRSRARRCDCALRRDDWLREPGDCARQLGARRTDDRAGCAAARRLPAGDGDARGPRAARGIHVRGLSQSRRLGGNEKHSRASAPRCNAWRRRWSTRCGASRRRFCRAFRTWTTWSRLRIPTAAA